MTPEVVGAALIFSGFIALVILLTAAVARVIEAFRGDGDEPSGRTAGDRVGTCRACRGPVRLDPLVGTVQCPCGEVDMPDDLLELEVAYVLPTRQGAAW